MIAAMPPADEPEGDELAGQELRRADRRDPEELDACRSSAHGPATGRSSVDRQVLEDEGEHGRPEEGDDPGVGRGDVHDLGFGRRRDDLGRDPARVRLARPPARSPGPRSPRGDDLAVDRARRGRRRGTRRSSPATGSTTSTTTWIVDCLPAAELRLRGSSGATTTTSTCRAARRGLRRRTVRGRPPRSAGRRRPAPGRSRRRRAARDVGGTTTIVSSGRFDAVVAEAEQGHDQERARARGSRSPPGRRTTSTSSLPTIARRRSRLRAMPIRRPCRARRPCRGRSSATAGPSARTRRAKTSSNVGRSSRRTDHPDARSAKDLHDAGTAVPASSTTRLNRVGSSCRTSWTKARSAKIRRSTGSCVSISTRSPPIAWRRSSSGVAEGDEPALGDEGDPVACLGFVDVLRRDQERAARVAQPMELRPRHVARRSGSMPAVGSSRNRSAGSWTSAQASSSRRCMPPDRSELAGVRAPSHSSTSSRTSRVRRRRARKNRPYRLADEVDVLASRQVRVEREGLRHVADPLAGLAAEAAPGPRRARRPRPQSGSMARSAAGRSSSCPHPDGPMRPRIVPDGTRRVRPSTTVRSSNACVTPSITTASALGASTRVRGMVAAPPSRAEARPRLARNRRRRRLAAGPWGGQRHARQARVQAAIDL